MCNVWYQANFNPDRLRFISRPDREHSANIRRDPRVAGSIIAIPLEGLGQIVRGVTFTGTAHELPAAAPGNPSAAFLARWPAARNALDPPSGPPPNRLYEITVETWTLFDEKNFPDQPRRVVSGSY